MAPATCPRDADLDASFELDRRSSNIHTIDDRQGSTLGNADPLPAPQVVRAWHEAATAPLHRIYRRLLGLRPFKTTYLSLYEPLDSYAERSIAIASAFFAIVAGVPLPIIGYIFGKIINDFPPEPGPLHQRLVQLLGVAVAYFVVTAIYTIGFGITAENVSVKLRRRLLECLLHLDQAYLDTHDIDVNGLLSEKMDTIQAGCSEKVGIFIQSLSYFVAAFVVGFILNAKLTGILLASVVPALTLCFAFLSPAVSKFSRVASQYNGQANELVESALRAVKIVQAFDMIGKLCQQHIGYLDSQTDANVKKAAFAASQSGAIYFIAFAANALAFYVGSRLSTGGNAGTVYAVVFLILDASFVVGQFAPFLEIFARAASAKAQIQDLLDASEQQTSATYRASSLKPNLRGKDIVFRDASFEYPARPNVKVLDSLDLCLKPGTFTALVGTSGGGKSTIVALLLGIYEYRGHITFGADEVQSIDSKCLRSQIAVVDQDTTLFSGTVFDNVCYGLIGHDLTQDEKSARCKQALKEANVDFLDRLPDGMHTRLGNEMQLSGGQRQRICLARALIKRPALLILDEPTSALDATSEVAVMEAVKTVAASGTTVLMIAHRLSTTLAADHIAVVSEGKIVEEGSPNDLSEGGAVFRGLLDAQQTNMPSREESPTASEASSMHRVSTALTTSADVPPGIDDVPPQQEDAYAAKMSFKNVAGRILRMSKPEGWMSLLGIFASVVSGGILLGQAIIFGNLIELLNGGRQGTSYYNSAEFFCLMFFILALIALSSYITSGSVFGVISIRLTSRVQKQMLYRLLHLDLQWFFEAGHSTHRLMGAFTKDPGDLAALGGVALGAIFTIMTSVVGGLVLALAIAWKIAIVLFSMMPVMVVAGFLRLRILTISETKHREAYSGATSLAAESCRNRRAVTALCLEQHLLDEYRQALYRPYHQIRNFVLIANTLLAFCFSVTYFVYALAYWWGSKQVRNGTYTTTEFFIVLPALLFSAQQAGQFFSLSPEVARAKTAARSVFTLLDAEPKIMRLYSGSLSASSASKLQLCSSSKNLIPGSRDETPVRGCPKLEFRNISLIYPNAKGPALQNVNLQIHSGQTVAFVGPSGAGKSSTMALVERFLDPTSGTMMFDGIDYRDIDVQRLRSRMGLVTQDPDLFPGSIAYNIKLGSAPDQTITDGDIQVACQKCGLHDFITSLPEGYSTNCSSGLSGGQKQRLSIARALIRNPDILLLDEPTSALDAHSEAHVQAALLAEASKDRTTIMVAHRLASIQHCDRIYVFDNGSVVEQGTHSELVQQDGLYASMAKAQSLA
ncbi:related to multidrug resistance [Lecanosticta acicola]|uniref:Related to multidrug resistance n=1 Tax=Lecanosticta acicola TaxID=111012 RepID=A0AAI9E8X2_9PEZI|nr:related to multidrug resistance [Lecanosticta acicola]